MEKNDAFAGYHPLINFLFFLGAFVCGMFFLHPVCLLVSVFPAAGYYLSMRGSEGIRFLGGLILLFIFVSAINPIFNQYGERILFSMGNRVYTFEALAYGMALGGMMVAILIWFACWQRVMTSDKFLYLFGHLAPSVTLILTMILRLVPSYQRKMQQIHDVRKCIGHSLENGKKREKVMHGMTVLSATISWALEGGITMADSMKSRGYGCADKRSTFSIYRFEGRDKALFILMAFLLAVTIICGARGGMGVTYTPTLYIAANGYTLAGALSYGIFLFIPLAINLAEEIQWHILRSRI